MRKRAQHIRARSLMAGLSCALAFLAALGWLAPLVAAGVAALDDTHEVHMAVGTGGSRVVLAHPNAGGSVTAPHDHAGMTAALVALSAPADRGGDHVLSFPGGVECLRLESSEWAVTGLSSVTTTDVHESVAPRPVPVALPAQWLASVVPSGRVFGTVVSVRC